MTALLESLLCRYCRDNAMQIKTVAIRLDQIRVLSIHTASPTILVDLTHFFSLSCRFAFFGHISGNF